MGFNAQKFLEDYQIPFSTSGKNVSPGWIAVTCPMCDDLSNHGAFDPKGKLYSCWKCGSYSIKEIIKELLGVNTKEANYLFRKYSGDILKTKKEKEIIRANSLCLPKEANFLKVKHRNYLKKRNFDPNLLELEWKIKGTAHLGDYKFRIIIPIFYGGKLVSYQGRDVSGHSDLKYKACKQEKEIIHHKHILYGLDQVNRDTIIVVEGIFDVWRFGAGNAIATFGIKYTKGQLLEICKRKFKKVYIMFDSEEQAIMQAESLAVELGGFGIDTEVITLSEGDPSDLSDKQASDLVKELLR